MKHSFLLVTFLRHFYVKGGYYFDVDMGAVKPVRLPPEISFASPSEYDDHHGGLVGIFNSFVAAAPGQPILRTNLDLFLIHYRGEENLPLRSKDHHMGTGTMRLAFDRTPQEQRGEVFSFLQESNLKQKRAEYRHVRPQRGTGCCCDFFVENTKEKEIHFWSRIPGSNWMCEPARGRRIH